MSINIGRWRVAVMLLLMVLVLGTSLVPVGAQARVGAGDVVVIPVTGTIDSVLARFIERSIADAERRGAAGIILEIITLGGRVDAALDIRDAVLGADIPVAAFVKRRAWSAGALITLACPLIAMAPGSSMGAAEPRPLDEKTLSALKAEFEATADAGGRDPKIAAAMVDRMMVIEGIVDRDELLTLTYRRAVELGMADCNCSTREEILEALGLGGANVVEMQLRRTERLARYVVDPNVAGILVTLGFLGLITEVTSPGFGVPGLLGLTFLGAFFGGHLLAGFAGWEVIALFLLGIMLLAVEAFVPGFGVFGAGGIGAILFSIYLSAETTEQAVRLLTFSIVATTVLGFFVVRLLGRRGFWSRLALGATLSSGEGYLAGRSRVELVGAVGETLTPLRPAGSALFGDERVDVVTDGDFIGAGQRVTVTRIEGMRVIVRVLKEEQQSDGR